jgi:hypothetical protein
MGEALLKAVFTTILDAIWALLIALPVMWLTFHLHNHGSPLEPLSYWQSWWAAFLLMWIIDGAGSVRRIMEAVDD